MIIFVICVASFGNVLALGDIRNLMGEPDYRQVRLHWETDEKSAAKGFQIRYCELQTWGTQRCRLQTVPEPEDNNVDQNDHVRLYTTDIKGLRMATRYSFEVRANRTSGERENRASGDDKNQNVIVIPTKGFSAKATQCLPHASEIEVSTGPYFAGRIAVEAADGERCALDGEPSSPRDIYTLRINHTECGSHVNETTVATFVIVQENLPILTHSTRRFLVLCSYQPETLTVRAGINLPHNHIGRGQAEMEPVQAEENPRLGRKGRNMRSGRVLQRPEALVKEERIEERSYPTGSSVVPIFVISMLTLAVLIALVALILKIANKRLIQEFDNVSVVSEISTSSCSTVSEVESSCERKEAGKTLAL